MPDTSSPGAGQYPPDQGSDAASLLFIAHGTRQYARRISRKEWSRVRPTLLRLNQEGHTRARMMAVLKEQFDFEPSSNQLSNKMNAWGYKPLFKNSQDVTTIDPTVSVTTSNQAAVSWDPSDSSSSFSAQRELSETSSPELVSDTTNTSATSAEDNTGYSSFGEDFTHLHEETVDLQDFDRYDVLNDVAYFLHASNSFSEAFHLFSRCSSFLNTQADVKPSTITFAEINCLRTATSQSEQRLATDISSRAANQVKQLSADCELGHATYSWLDKLSKDLCGVPNFTSRSSCLPYPQDDGVRREGPNKSSSAELTSDTFLQDHLVRWCDPFLLARRQTWFLSQWMATYQHDAYIVGTMIDWCAKVLLDSDYDESLGPYCCNPRDQHSRANYATVLACYMLQRWLRQSPGEILTHWCPVYPPGQQRIALIISSKVCVQVIFALCHLIVRRASQAWTGYRISTYGEVPIAGSLALDQTLLQAHFDALSTMPAHIRFREFALAHHDLSTRDISFRRQMHKTLVTKAEGQLQLMVVQHVRETADALAKFAIGLRRDTGHTSSGQSFTPPASGMTPESRPLSPSESNSDSERQSVKSDDMNRFRRFAKHIAKLSNTKRHRDRANANSANIDFDQDDGSDTECRRGRPDMGVDPYTSKSTSMSTSMSKSMDENKSVKKRIRPWKPTGGPTTFPNVAGFGSNTNTSFHFEPAILSNFDYGIGHDYNHDYNHNYNHNYEHEYEHEYDHDHDDEYTFDFDTMMIDV